MSVPSPDVVRKQTSFWRGSGLCDKQNLSTSACALHRILLSDRSAHSMSSHHHVYKHQKTSQQKDTPKTCWVRQCQPCQVRVQVESQKTHSSPPPNMFTWSPAVLVNRCRQEPSSISGGHEVRIGLLRRRAAMTTPVLPSTSAREQWFLSGLFDRTTSHGTQARLTEVTATLTQGRKPQHQTMTTQSPITK